jgi:hypothetical protein
MGWFVSGKLLKRKEKGPRQFFGCNESGSDGLKQVTCHGALLGSVSL